MIQWFCGADEGVVAQVRQKLRGMQCYCKKGMKTRLWSDYSYYMILIVEETQPIRYMHKQG